MIAQISRLEWFMAKFITVCHSFLRDCDLNHIFCMMGSLVYRRTAMCIVPASCSSAVSQLCQFSENWHIMSRKNLHNACNLKQLFDPRLPNDLLSPAWYQKKKYSFAFYPTSVWQMLFTVTRSAMETSKLLRKGIFVLEGSGMESTHDGIFSTDDVKEKAVQK